jgi:cell division protein FtsW
MNKLSFLRGDKTIWAMIILLGIISFLPVYSASTNLVYTVGSGNGSTFVIFIKHLMHIILGLGIVYVVHKLPYTVFKRYNVLTILIIMGILAYTLLQGKTIGGANASRWINLPFIGMSFQPSTLAFIVLMVYVAGILAKLKDTKYNFKETVYSLWLPVFGVLILIFPTNFSTTALIFAMVCMLVYVGQYPIKYLANVLGICVLSLVLFYLLAKAFPDNKYFSRLATWEKRIERFVSDAPDEDNYQIEKAKIAIASGQLFGLGPGDSVQKNFLPQSSSDFIFAVIVEEYGLLGGFSLIVIYIILFFRFLVCANKANSLFGKLLIVGLGFPIIFQAFLNMGVAVELLPVTGQPLPLISSGGTSIWMTCTALGIILSVTKKDIEIAADLDEQNKREEALKRIIDREVVSMETEQDYAPQLASMRTSIQNSILEDNQGDSLYKGQNPMNSVLNKK